MAAVEADVRAAAGGWRKSLWKDKVTDVSTYEMVG